MYIIWASKAQFLGHFGPQSKKNFWCLVISQKVFIGFTTILLHMLIPSTFRCVENMAPNLWATLGPQISQNSGLWSFSEKFPLVAHQSWCACQFGLLLEVCWILAPEAQFPGHFGRQIDHNSGNFIKYFPIVSHHSRLTCLLGVLLCVFQLCAPKALFLGLELRLQRSLLCHQASCIQRVTYYIITSSNENVFCVAVPLWEESTRHRWIPFTKGW